MTARKSTAVVKLDGNVQLQREAQQLLDSYTLLAERFAELEFSLEDQGWTSLSGGSDREFSRDGLTKIIRVARLAYLKNPLIRHATNVQADYVWGQGVDITAKDDSVNEVVQGFLDDKLNQKELSGHTAHIAKEVEQRITGNTFFALFTNSSNGYVRIRTIPVEEIVDIIRNPDDDLEPWFYKRIWNAQTLDNNTGLMDVDSKTAYYPSMSYRPTTRIKNIGDDPVMWDTPIYHIKTGGFDYMKFGVPEVYSALDWAKAVKEDLEDYATLKRALARFAWNLKTPGGKSGVAAVKTKLSTTLGSGSLGAQQETNPPPAIASTFIRSGENELQPIKTAGATISPEEGRRMWLMVGSGVSLPETMLSGDSTEGNYATAKSLDRPTELHMSGRQTDWAGWFTDILDYVIDQAAVRVNGLLSGTYIKNPNTGELEVKLVGVTDRSIDIRFPSILQRDPLPQVQAIIGAATLNGQVPAGTMDLRTLTKLLMSALGEEDVDEMLGLLFPGNDDATLVPEKRTQAMMTPSPAAKGTGGDSADGQSGAGAVSGASEFTEAAAELRTALEKFFKLREVA